jgi:hypothetical protein
VTRDKDDKLLSVVFKSEDPEQWIKKSADGKSWQSEPPFGRNRVIVDVAVDSAGTIVLKLIDGGKKGSMTLHTSGKVTGGFDPD